MTAEEWETLKKAQAQAIRAGNLAELNRINKALFEERERRQKAREKAREQEREKVLYAKISTFCEKCFLRKMGENRKKGAFCPFCNNYKFILRRKQNGIYWNTNE